MGLGREKLDRAVMDESALRLPAALDVFPAREDNAALYEWLAAWFANAVAPEGLADDPLRNDLLRLRAAVETTRATLARWPGLAPIYDRLSRASLEARPRRSLPSCEAALEAAIEFLLGGAPARAPDPKFLAAIRGTTPDLSPPAAPMGYATYLPVPVWGEIAETGGQSREDADEEGGDSANVDQLRRRAMRRPNDQSQRGDPLLLHRFETIFSIAEMVNVNREVDDDDENAARAAADDLPELRPSAPITSARRHA